MIWSVASQPMVTLAWPPTELSRPGTRAIAAAAPRSSDPGSTWMECTAAPRRFVVFRMMYESSARNISRGSRSAKRMVCKAL